MAWTTQKTNNWYKDKGWIVGFNYVTSSAINSTEMWDADTFDSVTIQKEFEMASKIGFNSCRVFLQYLVWEKEQKEFIKNFDTFLAIAANNNITVMPTLFDDCAFSHKEPFLGKQDEPVLGIHNSGWTPSPGFLIADDRAYLNKLQMYFKSIINKYRNDPRIIAWDLYNEPGNSGRNEKCLDLLLKSFEWARDCNPSQPLTAGVWAWKEFDLKCEELSDVISFHDYMKLDVTKERIEEFKKCGRPMFCTEWLHRIEGNNIETHMPFYKENNIAIYNWGLVQGKTQTNLSWREEDNCQNSQPAIWQHDILRSDLTPYSPFEINFIKEITSKK